MRKKIAIALAAGVAFGTMFTAPIATPVVEAASSESVLKLKSPAETYAMQGKKLADEGKYEEAAEAYKKAAEEDENNDVYWFSCGLSYFNAKNYKAATGPLKKAVKLQPQNGNYNFFYGVSLWCYAGDVNSGKASSLMSGTEDLMDRGDQYVKRAAELMPDNANVQSTAGGIAEAYANHLSYTGGFKSYINEEYQRAYRHFRRAAELDPSKGAELTRFVNAHPGYGFQPYTPATQSVDPAPGVDRQPGTQAQPGGNVDVTGATNAPSGEFYKALAGNIEYEELKSGVVKLNTNVTCAANAPRGGSLQNIVGDIEYEVLDSGAVQFNLRCGNWFIDEQPNRYKLTNYIFTKPEKFRAYPGAYMVGRLTDEGVIVIDHTLFNGSSFDYNPKTQTFTFYEWYYSDNPNPAERAAIMALPLGVELMRLIDKNTVYVESGAPYRLIDGELYPNKSYYTNTYRYMPYNKTSLTITKVDSPTFKYDYPDQGNSIGHGAGEFDENQCVWFGNLITKNAFHTFPSLFFHHGTTYHGEILLNWNVDAMRAFLAVNGNIGAAPYDVVFMEEDAQYLQ